MMPISVAAHGSSDANVSRYRSATASTCVGARAGASMLVGVLTKVVGGEGVALVGVAGLVADREPLLPLRGRPVRPGFGVDPSGRRLLDAVVAHRRGGGQRVGNVLVAQRLKERHTGALLFGDGSVVRPDTRITVGLQLGADTAARRALRILLCPAEVALQVLHVVAVLVCHDVLLRQRAAAGAELVDEHLEEIGVEVSGLVNGAVERPDVAGRGSAAGLNLTVKQRGMRWGVPR